mmetsp:Transcript_120002/g.208395  ORF Transcript_120002/g.208395 Transcript_120002/m.208395 type:complete len:150 (+) Transcript_120002:89-538(+)
MLPQPAMRCAREVLRSNRFASVPRWSVPRTFATAAAPRAMETWEEVELHRPKAPTLEGYVRPAGAPEQFDLTRDQYHQFMLGKPAKYSVELRNFLMGLGVVSFILAEFAFTIYKLRPDDLDWVDEERIRAAAAKARIEARIQAQQAKEE